MRKENAHFSLITVKMLYVIQHQKKKKKEGKPGIFKTWMTLEDIKRSERSQSPKD